MSRNANALDEINRAAELPENEDPRYQLLEHLGQGGMGRVYLAKHLSTDRTVVLKMPLPMKPQESEAAFRRRSAMFLQEMKVSVELEHTNIVRVYDCGGDWGGGSEPFLVMEWVKGLSIRELLKLRSNAVDADEPSLGTLSWEHVVLVLMQACEGLHYAHNYKRTGEGDTEAGVIHRDISEDNMMVNTNGIVKLFDWGITKATNESGEAAKTETVAGKIRYMSPEQLQGHPVDARADIYSLGIAAIVMLSGRQVFTEPNDALRMFQICSGQRPAVAELVPDAPPSLQVLLEEMISTKREARPADANATLERLHAIVLDEGKDTLSLRRAFAEDVGKAYKSGQRTRRIPVHREVPSRSEQRLVSPPISPATQPDGPSRSDRTAPLPFKAQAEPLAQTAQLEGQESTSALQSQPPVSPQRAPRSGLVVAVTLAAVAALVGTAAFLAPSLWENEPDEAALGEPSPPSESESDHEEIESPPVQSAEPSGEGEEPVATPETDPGPLDGTSEAGPGEAAPAHIRIVVVPYGEARLNGERISLRREHEVPAGRHRITATHQGQRQARNVELEPGSSQRVVFRFLPR